MLPLLNVPVVGKPIADLLQPALQVLIELGYDRTGPADVPTPFGLFPDVDLGTVFENLMTAGQQGVNAFVSDLSDLSLSSLAPDVSSSALLGMPDLVTGLADTLSDPGALFTDLAHTISSTAAGLSYVALRSADLAYAVLADLPAYNVNLFLDNIANPVDAFGLPIAADVGLLTLAAGFEFLFIEGAVNSVISELTP